MKYQCVTGQDRRQQVFICLCHVAMCLQLNQTESINSKSLINRLTKPDRNNLVFFFCCFFFRLLLLLIWFVSLFFLGRDTEWAKVPISNPIIRVQSMCTMRNQVWLFDQITRDKRLVSAEETFGNLPIDQFNVCWSNYAVQSNYYAVQSNYHAE